MLEEHKKEITFETNGTMRLTKGFKDFLTAWQQPPLGDTKDHEITFSVSAKLPCSGEPWDDAIKPEVVCDYENYGYTYLKFVVATEQDVADAECAVGAYRAAGFKGPVYIMPVGGVERVYTLNNRTVAEMAMRKGWRYSDRLQVPLFKNEWGT
jgi:hypothetical protein